MKMDVNLKTSFTLLLVAGVSIAWRPIADDRRCQVYSPAPASTKCGSYRYQYDRKTNLCQPTCFTAAPFSSFMECSENCRSIEVCFMHRPLSSCGSGTFPVYYFNPMKDACFVEQGCTYKGNNFPTLAECQRTCRAKTQGPSQIPLGVPGSGGPSHHNPSQSSTGGVPPFTQQTPQSTWNRPMPPQQNTHSWNGGIPPSNQQQGSPGQSSQGTVPPPWNNPTASTSSHQGPQQSWSSGVPPMQQNPVSVSPFPAQSGQQSWNGQAVSQPGVQQQWSNGIPPFNPQQQQGAGTLSPYPQQPGQQPWSGQMASPNQPQSPQQQWNGAQPTNNQNTALQQSGSGTMPTSPHATMEHSRVVRHSTARHAAMGQWKSTNKFTAGSERPNGVLKFTNGQPVTLEYR
ncbi:uncharacterized protein LOC119465299 [Dermacentor silvarum]|uniref:uncharacterized protein LOC119465299 n=1 Tax=Dermacentor silvarum TaxID=543639 RepID=UPI00189826EB|nr:uncharacterized protein LOC119465299 [Dermacentor silvarum]